MNYWSYMEVPWLAAFVSFMIGFGVAAMFRPLCNGPECYVVHGPPVADVIHKVYQMGERCVEFSTEVVSCPKKDSPEAAQLVHTVKRVATA